MYHSITKASAAASAPSFAALLVSLLCVFPLLAGAASQMPYIPTRVLQNGSHVYVFQPSSSSSSQFELGTIDIASGIDSSDLPFTTLYPTLPFLDSEKQQPFNPILNHGGNITVYTGDCALGASGAEVWSFVPETSEKRGNGSWTKEDVTFTQGGRHVSDMGPNYLSAGMSFSAIVGGDAMDTEAYFFGGMCPSKAENNADWQSNANYSNYMVTLEPSGTTQETVKYQLDLSSSRGPPIAEAGFTLTDLPPSFSNRSDGTQTQQQNFVLIGGHTSAAFINTSQAALFSLPQRGWTFVPVNQPDTARTDLAIRADVSTIEPRSGHSTVLAPDGQRLIVFGGWIGDINTPADPQLAVLNIGNGYGGEGDWGWIVPSTSGSGLPSATGIYGHGAAMLPGGIMMIVGGYSISTPSAKRRGLSPRANTRPMFFNTSSYTWITDYSPPADIRDAQAAKNGPLATPGQKAGLGAGLGIGMAAVLGLMGFYIWYTRKLKRQREFRESQLHELAMGAHRYTLSPGFDGRGDYINSSADSYYYPSPPGQQNSSWRQTKGRDAERTGLLVEIPSPTRGLRRSLGGRVNPLVRGSGHIHPIDEEEEQEQEGANDKTPLTSQPEMTQRSADRGPSIFDNAPILNPFMDQNRLGVDNGVFHSAPTSPIQEDMDDPHEDHHSWNVPLGIPLPRHSSPSPPGRVSPTKSSERTGSNLSERSTRSNLSSYSNAGSLGRSASMRSAAILNHAANANPFKTPDGSPTDATNRAGSGWQTLADARTRSITSIRSNGRPNTSKEDADSFATARSSFMVLQAEGEALLGGNPERARPGTSSTSNGSNTHSSRDTEPSMSRAGTVTAATSTTEGLSRKPLNSERRMSWLGSVRRALARSTSAADRTRSLTTAAMHYESYTDNPKTEHTERIEDVSTSTSTATAKNRKSFPPRRAASDASFWRSKRGKHDWLEEEMDPNDPRAKWKRNSGDDWGTPEDAALAEKERLRTEWRERGNLLINLTDEDGLPTPRTPITPGDLGLPPPLFPDRDRPCTPADEDDWDVEAAVERRVVQVMFTVPKSKLRVVNADADCSSLLSLPRENSKGSLVDENNNNTDTDTDAKNQTQQQAKNTTPSSNQDAAPTTATTTTGTGTGTAPPSPSPSPSRVKHLAGRFESLATSHESSTPILLSHSRTSPRPSPSPSIKSMKLRARNSAASLAAGAGSTSHSVSPDRAGEKEKGKGRAGE